MSWPTELEGLSSIPGRGSMASFSTKANKEVPAAKAEENLVEKVTWKGTARFVSPRCIPVGSAPETNPRKIWWTTPLLTGREKKFRSKNIPKERADPSEDS